MFKLGLERERKQRSNGQHPSDHRKNNRIPEKHLLLLHSLLYKAFDGMDHNGNIKPPYLPPEKPVCRSRSNRMGYGTTDWFKIGKAVSQDYIVTLFSTSCEIPGWMQLESGSPGEVSITSDM